MRLYRVILTGLFLSFALSGCTLLKEFDQRIALKNCHFQLMGVKEINYNPLENYDKLDVILNLGIQNPNPKTEVRIDRMRYSLFIDGVDMVSANNDLTIHIPAAGEIVAPLAVNLSVRQMEKSTMRAIQARQVNYKLTGTVFYSTPVGDFSFPVTIKEGQWSQ